jgi:protein-S-isoprenylcysteine O-methyltransferase Ste14
MSNTPLGWINSVFNNRTISTALFKLRFPLAAIGGALLIWQIDPAWFWPGFAVSIVGALAQCWCFASLQKNERLCAQGPYSIVRNPMYLARFILIFGVMMLLGINGWRVWVLPVYTVIYIFYMYNRVRREEKRLLGLFGASYEKYCATIHRFLPGFRCYEDNRLLYFRWDLLIRNHGLWNLLGVLAFYAVTAGYIFWLAPR